MSLATGSRHPALDVAQISDYSWVFGKSVDRLVTVEMRPTGLPYGKIDRLLDAALAESGYKSQTLVAAHALARQPIAADSLRPAQGVTRAWACWPGTLTSKWVFCAHSTNLFCSR